MDEVYRGIFREVFRVGNDMNDLQNNYCVYKHTCPNGKIYIGITKQNPVRRWGHGYGYRSNPRFYSAISRYGWDSIKHEILFDGLSKEEAENKEIELIAYHKSNVFEYGYNRDNGGNCTGTHSISTLEKMSRVNKGKHLTSETREKMSAAHKGKRHSEETCQKLRGKKSLAWRAKMSEAHPNKKAVAQYDKDGNFVNIYSSLREAERETGTSYVCIYLSIKRNGKTADGSCWKYINSL